MPPQHPQYDESRKMWACEWHGTRSVKVAQRGVPVVTDARDAIVRVTTTTVCGSDLHLYANAIPTKNMLQKGDILGHEGVGVIEAVGSAVKNFKPGQRVVISSIISCGECEYCKQGKPALCDTTNPSQTMQKIYGHNIAGLFGYSHMTGGYEGTQAEYCRVPLADCNLLAIQDLPDDKAIFLSDVLCTGWHGNELGETGKDTNTLLIHGAGPIGLSVGYLARHRGVKRIIIIDHNEDRLALAQRMFGAETINFDKVSSVVEEVMRRSPRGVDVAIDAVGFRFATSMTQKLSHAFGADSADVITEAAFCTRKGGRIVLIGDYFAHTNMFPIGTIMEKGITMTGGQLWPQRYWTTLLPKVVSGEIDPTFLITHWARFDQIADVYETFFEQHALKIMVKTAFGERIEAEAAAHISQSKQLDASHVGWFGGGLSGLAHKLQSSLHLGGQPESKKQPPQQQQREQREQREQLQYPTQQQQQWQQQPSQQPQQVQPLQQPAQQPSTQQQQSQQLQQQSLQPSTQGARGSISGSSGGISGGVSGTSSSRGGFGGGFGGGLLGPGSGSSAAASQPAQASTAQAASQRAQKEAMARSGVHQSRHATHSSDAFHSGLT